MERRGAAKPIRAQIAICITLFGSFELTTAQNISLIFDLRSVYKQSANQHTPLDFFVKD
jgi:hypothetical protein